MNELTILQFLLLGLIMNFIISIALALVAIFKFGIVPIGSDKITNNKTKWKIFVPYYSLLVLPRNIYSLIKATNFDEFLELQIG